MPIMHCPSCGQKTSADLKFCRSCGMKLDSVARALNEHLIPGEQDAELEKAVETKSGRRPGNASFNRIYIGIAMMFIGIVIGVAGEGIWGAKTAAVVISLLGMLIMALSFLPMAARYDRELLSSIGKAGGKKEIPGPERKVELSSGDDFEPAAKAVPVPSVTEGTTRNLDEEKIKVSR